MRVALSAQVPHRAACAAPVADLMQNPAVKAALDAAKASEPQTIADQIRFCEIPAPPFKEEVRGRELKRVFQQLGLQNVRVDKAGNVLGDYPGAAPRPHLVIAAHLDTVFPEGTDVQVKREGTILRGPGIGDDCRGLAVLVAIAREMKKANVQTPGTITFVANVGEEGLGDLRGVKQLFNDTLKGQIDRFVSIDGTGVHVTNVAVGSHRYRVTFKGPGGHSFGAFGLANPIGAMGRAIAKIQELQVPQAAEDDLQRRPRRRRHVGELDSVRGVDGSRHAVVGSGVARGGRRELPQGGRRRGRRGERALGHAGHDHRGEGAGRRSAGRHRRRRTRRSSRTGLATATALGFSANLGEGSTDSNMPMSLKHPGDHDRRRRPRPRRARAHRIVRHDRLVDGHAARAAADDRVRAH